MLRLVVNYDVMSAAVAVCRKPCINGARCVDVDVCQCRHGYSGSSCETGLRLSSYITNSYQL